MFRKKIHAKGLLLIALIFLLSGCLSDLEKPTGLENHEDQNLLLDEDNNSYNLSAEGLDQKEDQEEDSSENKEKSEENNSDEMVENSVEENEDSREGKDEPSSTPSSKDSSRKDEASRKKESTKKQGNSKPEEKEETKKEESKEEPPKEKPKEDQPEENNQPTITHSIVIAAEGSYGQQVCLEKKYDSCPEDGRAEVPLPPTKMIIENEITVLEALIEITMAKKIEMDYRGGRGATAYIEGIDNVHEFDRGQGSGWMYRVNGIFPDRGAGVVPLCDGDVVEWLYTTNLGRDLDADLEPFRRDGKCP